MKSYKGIEPGLGSREYVVIYEDDKGKSEEIATYANPRDAFKAVSRLTLRQQRKTNIIERTEMVLL